MAGFAPRFCPKHLKIHVCDDQDVFNKSEQIHDDLGAKVRRLHGKQTAEELEAEAKKREDKPGTLGDILAKAKQKIAQDKKTNPLNDEEKDLTPVSEGEISDRMAALRAKMGGNTPSNDNLTKETNSTLSQPSKELKNESIESIIDIIEEVIDFEPIVKENEQVKPKKANVKSTNNTLSKPKTAKEKLFTQEETQELIQTAVKEALKQIGIIDSDEKPKKVIKKPTKKRENQEDKNNQKIDKTKIPDLK